MMKMDFLDDPRVGGAMRGAANSLGAMSPGGQSRSQLMSGAAQMGAGLRRRMDRPQQLPSRTPRFFDNLEQYAPSFSAEPEPGGEPIPSTPRGQTPIQDAPPRGGFQPPPMPEPTRTPAPRGGPRRPYTGRGGVPPARGEGSSTPISRPRMQGSVPRFVSSSEA